MIKGRRCGVGPPWVPSLLSPVPMPIDSERWNGVREIVRGKSGPAVGPDDSVTVSNGLAHRLLLILLEPGLDGQMATSRVSPSGAAGCLAWPATGLLFRGARRTLGLGRSAQTNARSKSNLSSSQKKFLTPLKKTKSNLSLSY